MVCPNSLQSGCLPPRTGFFSCAMMAAEKPVLAGDWRAAAYWLAIHCPAWRRPKPIAMSGAIAVTTDR